ncbi:HAD family hydrolase [Streptomyces flavofungini]|uniref:HAD family hydrolase n=1 Tax=Streptomyces flavofungini TaxID=68200 RepID=UPI0034DFFA0B
MNSDSTRSEATSPEIDRKEIEVIRLLIAEVRIVLFDFDGPICRLFAGLSAQRVAGDLVRWLEERGLHELLTDEEKAEPDPYVVLRAVDRRHPRSELVDELERWLTQQELHAVRTAWPTMYADPLIRTWSAVGVRLAVTTNNSPAPVSSYLATRGLLDCFGPHVYGRTGDLSLLKPDPYCVHRALNALGAEPRDALMIGDAPSDYEAARQAGVRFLGYARNERKAELLRKAGARDLVASLVPVLGAVRAPGATKPR